MTNVKLVGNIMLAAVALSAPYLTHQPSPTTTATITVSCFIASEGVVQWLALPAKEPEAVPTTYGPTYTVTATAYQAVPGQTDDEPFVTADNSFIKPQYSSKTRWLALSQDLLARWGGKFNYGDKVRVSGISSQLDGIYTIHDTMNRRHRHCIDVLTHPSEKFDIFTKDVKINLAFVPVPSVLPALVAAVPTRTRARHTPATAVLQSFRGRWPVGPRSRKNRSLPEQYRPNDYFASVIL